MLAILIVSMWAYVNVARHWGEWNVDMSAVYMAARFIFLDEFAHIYAAPEGFFGTDITTRWADELVALGYGEEVAVPYVYPPLWGYLLSPLAGRLDPIAFYDLTRVVLTSCYAVSILLVWRLMRPKHLTAALFAVIGIIIAEMTIPVQFALMLNQPQLLVVMMILLSFERYLSGYIRTAGIILGVAAAIKITPIMFCLIFLMDRNWRALSACLLTAGGLMLASFVVFGIDPHLGFMALVSQIDSLVPIIGLNANLELFLHQLSVPIEARQNISGGSVAGQNILWITLVNRAALILMLASAYLATRDLSKDARIQMRLFLFSMVFVVCGPLGWVHYYMLLLLLLPGLWGIFSLVQTGILTVLSVAVFSLPMTLITLLTVKNYNLFAMVAVPAVLIVFTLTIRFCQQSCKARLSAFDEGSDERNPAGDGQSGDRPAEPASPQFDPRFA